jgi:hypothetical protein
MAASSSSPATVATRPGVHLPAEAAAALGLSLLVGVLPFDPGSPLAWAAYLLVLAHTLPLAGRRRWPLGVLVWALATGAAFAAVGPSLVALSFTILIYVYTAAAHCPRRVSLAVLGGRLVAPRDLT